MGGPKFGPNWSKWGPKLGFSPFSEVSFLEIAQDDSLKQCQTTIRCKTHEKHIEGPKFGLIGSKLDPKFGFKKVSFLSSCIR